MATAVETGRLTEADALRDLLAKVEKGLVVVGEGDAVELFGALDEIAALLPGLLAGGADLRAEQSRWETVQAQVMGRAAAVLEAWKRRGGLAAARAQVEPSRAAWWWWLDELYAEKRRSRWRKGALVAGATLLAAVLLAAVLRPLLRVDPEVREAYRLQIQAEGALQAGDLAAALASYQQADRVRPAEPDTVALIGVLAETLGDSRLAGDSFAAARAASPDEAAFLVARGFGYLQAKAVDKALADGQHAVQLAPANGRAWMLVGSALEAQGNTSGAYDAFARAADFAGETDPELTVMARVRMAAMMQAIQAGGEVAPTP